MYETVYKWKWKVNLTVLFIYLKTFLNHLIFFKEPCKQYTKQTNIKQPNSFILKWERTYKTVSSFTKTQNLSSDESRSGKAWAKRYAFKIQLKQLLDDVSLEVLEHKKSS